MIEAVLGFLVLEGSTLLCVTDEPQPRSSIVVECSEDTELEGACLDLLEQATDMEDIPCEYVSSD